MKVDLTAMLKTFEDFMKVYQRGDENKLYNGKNLLFYALANVNAKERHKIADFLLQTDIDPCGVNDDQYYLLHVLLVQHEQDVPALVRTCSTLIERGVDINQRDNNGQVPLQYIVRLGKTDDELKELYDLWFSQKNVDVTGKDKRGFTPLKYAEGRPGREQLVKRIREYAEK